MLHESWRAALHPFLCLLGPQTPIWAHLLLELFPLLLHLIQGLGHGHVHPFLLAPFFLHPEKSKEVESQTTVPFGDTRGRNRGRSLLQCPLAC